MAKENMRGTGKKQRRKKQNGDGIIDWAKQKLDSADKYLKEKQYVKKYINPIFKAASTVVSVPYANHIQTGLNYLQEKGYGKTISGNGRESMRRM